MSSDAIERLRSLWRHAERNKENSMNAWTSDVEAALAALDDHGRRAALAMREACAAEFQARADERYARAAGYSTRVEAASVLEGAARWESIAKTIRDIDVDPAIAKVGR